VAIQALSDQLASATPKALSSAKWKFITIGTSEGSSTGGDFLRIRISWSCLGCSSLESLPLPFCKQ
jgi:hypothetical protein